MPSIQYPHGIGQKTGSNQYAYAATDRILIDDQIWQCWELDGTNDGKNLGLFKDKYEKVIRGLLEGHITPFILGMEYLLELVPLIMRLQKMTSLKIGK